MPLLWLPATATYDRSMVELLPSCEKMSCSLLMIGITEEPTTAAASVAAAAADGAEAEEEL